MRHVCSMLSAPTLGQTITGKPPQWQRHSCWRRTIPARQSSIEQPWPCPLKKRDLMARVGRRHDASWASWEQLPKNRNLSGEHLAALRRANNERLRSMAKDEQVSILSVIDESR